jgi:hypothetical protein
MASRRVTEGENAQQAPSAGHDSRAARESAHHALAADLAEKQMRDGTASSQIVTHYLKLGSTREKLEQERLMMENELAKAKIEAMASAARMEELYGKAIAAMRNYAGTPDPGRFVR